MKKFIVLSFLIVFTSIIFSCTKKSSSSSSTTTSTSSVASPSVNTSISIGGAIPGWVYNGCASTPNNFEAYNGPNIRARLFYNGPLSSLSSGTYTFTTGTPGVGQVQLILNDPPGQPSGYVWYSQNSQTCAINVIAINNVVATFNNITCTQSTTSTPVD